LSIFRRSIFENTASTARARESSKTPVKAMRFCGSCGAGPAPGEPDPCVAAGPTSGRIMQRKRNDTPEAIVNTLPTHGNARNPVFCSSFITASFSLLDPSPGKTFRT